MAGDRHFVVEMERAARIQAAVNSAPVYVYQFGYRGKHSLSELISEENTDFGITQHNITAQWIKSKCSQIADRGLC
jgi:hypothetical protein